jgi:hypothetical protein
MASVGEIKDRLKRAALRKVTSSPTALAAWGGFENLRQTGRGLVRATQVSSAERKRAAKEAVGESKAFGAPIQSFGNLVRDTGVVVETGARALSPRVTFKDALRETNAAVPRLSFASDALNKLESRGAIPRGSAKPIQFSSDVAASIMTPGIGKVNALSKLPAAQRLASYTALRASQGAVGGFVSEAGRTGDLEQAQRAAKTGALLGGVGNVVLSPKLTGSVLRGGADAIADANRAPVFGSTGGNIGKASKKQPTEKSLLTLHNASVQNILFAKKIGGLSNPSLATIDMRRGGFDKFGEVSLIADKGLTFGKKAKSFGADVYSPRFPSTEVDISYAGANKIIDRLKKYANVIDDDRIGMLSKSDIAYERLENQPAMLADFLTTRKIPIQKGASSYDTLSNMRKVIDEKGLRAELISHIDDLITDAGGKTKLFAGYTPNGNRKYAELTAENASKLMNKADVRGGEGFNYGLGSVRAKVAPQFSSQSQMKQQAGLIASEKDFEQAREQFDQEFMGLIEKFGKYSKYQNQNRFIEADETSEAISQYLAGDRGYFNSKFANVPKELEDELNTFASKLKSMPTEYFETKITRPVQIGEFSGALVPAKERGSIEAALKEAGITNIKYYADDADRLAKLKEFDDVAFKLLGDNDVVFNRTAQNITRELNGIFGKNVPIAFLDTTEQLTNKQAIGEVYRGTIRLLSESGSFSDAVAKHEGYHWLKRSLLNEADYLRLSQVEQNLLQVRSKDAEALRKIGYKEEAIAEELMADEFARYHKTGKTLVEKAKVFFDKIIQKGQLLFSKRGDVLKVFKNTAKYQTGIDRVPESIQTKLSSKKERGFIASAKEAESLADDVKAQVKGYYTSKANKDLLNEAIADLEKNPLETYVEDALNAKEITDKTVAKSIVAAQILNQRGDYEKAAEIIIKNAERLTEAGRTVQAASLLDKLTPEGIQTYAARELAKVGGELTGDDAKFLNDLALKIRELAPGRERNLAIQKMFEFVSDITPSPMMDRITSLWKAGLLTGFKTTGTNVLANTGHALLEKAKDPVAAVVDSVVSLITGKRTKTVAVGGLYKGAVQGAKEGADYLTTGYDPRLIGSKVREGRRVNYGRSKIGKATQAYVEGVFRFIGSQDRPFYQSRFQNSLADQAQAEVMNRGLQGEEAAKFMRQFVDAPPEQASMQAAIDAEIATFQNKTQLGQAASSLQKAGGGAGTLIIPFGKTPSAVATQIVNYSPVGLAKTIIENIGKGKFNQRAFSEGLGRGLTGTAILAIGYKMAERGMVNTSYPRTETERALWEAENRKANTLIVDGNQITAQALGPAGNGLLLGAYVYEAMQRAENPVAAGLAGLGNTLTESTFLSGLSSSIDALKDPLREGPRFMQKTAGSVVPTLASDVSRATDLNEQGKPITREVNTVGEAIINRTPWRRNLIESKDILGRGRKSGESALGTMFNPLRTATLNQDEQTKELRRLRTATGDDLTLSRIDKTQTIGGQKVKLTPTQQDALESEVSPQINEAISSLISNPLYSKLSDEEKVKAVESLITDIRAAGRLEFATENNLVTEEAIKKARESLSASAKASLVTEKFDVKKYLSSAKKKSGRKGRTRVKVSRPSKGTVKTFKAARTKKFKSAKTVKSLL